MARVALVQKNNKKRSIVQKFKKKRAELKSRIYDKNLSVEDRFVLVQRLALLPRNGIAVRVRNICALTGRSRGHLRKFGLSRIVVRELAGEGLLPGVIKSSW